MTITSFNKEKIKRGRGGKEKGEYIRGKRRLQRGKGTQKPRIKIIHVSECHEASVVRLYRPITIYFDCLSSRRIMRDSDEKQGRDVQRTKEEVVNICWTYKSRKRKKEREMQYAKDIPWVKEAVMLHWKKKKKKKKRWMKRKRKQTF